MTLEKERVKVKSQRRRSKTAMKVLKAVKNLWRNKQSPCSLKKRIKLLRLLPFQEYSN